MLDSIEVRYFKESEDSFDWIKSRIDSGFVFLVPTPSTYDKSSADEFEPLKGSRITHEIIGDEFKKVVTYIDTSLSYSDKGQLEGSLKEYYTIKNEVYVNMSRAKEKLALASIANEDVYRAIMERIFDERTPK